ncbi:MAG: adenylyltransferase/cytidyltransferase family protein [Candidatus Nanoarchaeia archaeon]
MTTVLVFGTFDLVHPGHIDFFRQAKKHGKRLIVVVARDKTIENVKGEMPKFDELTRLDAVSSVPEVDKAVLGSEGDKYEIIRDMDPDVICLGYDQFVFVDELEDKLKSFDMDIKILRMKAHKPEKYKSGLLKPHYHEPVMQDS